MTGPDIIHEPWTHVTRCLDVVDAGPLVDNPNECVFFPLFIWITHIIIRLILFAVLKNFRIYHKKNNFYFFYQLFIIVKFEFIKKKFNFQKYSPISFYIFQTFSYYQSFSEIDIKFWTNMKTKKLHHNRYLQQMHNTVIIFIYPLIVIRLGKLLFFF